MIQLNKKCLQEPDLRQLLFRLRQEKPLIHCITNYVTANDVANMLLAAGASPVMADAEQEVEEITALSKGLVLNLGTLKEASVNAMLLAGKRAAVMGHPIILDPVGAGASSFRTETALRLISKLPCTVIRGNASEIRTLAGVHAFSKGVDADIRDQVKEENCLAIKELLCSLSSRTGAVIVMTGKNDMVADSNRMWIVRNGNAMMTRITGMGCMMDGLLAAFQSVSLPEKIAQGEDAAEKKGDAEDKDPAEDKSGAKKRDYAEDKTGTRGYECRKNTVFKRSIYAVSAAGICGEMAAEMTRRINGGTGSFRMYYLDAMSRLSDQDIQGGAKIEV